MITKLIRNEKRNKAPARPYSDGLRALIRSRKGTLSAADQEALRGIGLDPKRPGRQFSFRLWRDPDKREARTNMSAVIGPQGGYLTRPGLVGAFESAIVFYSAVRSLASVVRLEKGEPLIVPTSNDVDREGELIPENSTQTNPTNPVFGAVTLWQRGFSSRIVQVPSQLVEDTGDLLVSVLGRLLGERIGRVQNRYFTGQLMLQATAGATAAGATSITYNDVLNLIYSVDAGYRLNGSFMAHPNVLLVCRELKDGSGRPLLLDGEGRTPTLAGYPCLPNLHMADTIQSGARTISFGDHARFMIKDVRDVELMVLAERFRDQDQDGFLAMHRADGALIDAGSHPVKYLAH